MLLDSGYNTHYGLGIAFYYFSQGKPPDDTLPDHTSSTLQSFQIVVE